MSKRRRSGEGTVRLRKDGRWEGRIVVGYDDRGLPKTKNVLAHGRQECLEKLKLLKADCGRPGLCPAAKARPDMSFGEWIDLWYQTYSKPGLRPTTREGYESAIYKHIIPSLGKTPLRKLSQNDLQRFYAKLKAGGRLTRGAQFGTGLSDRTVRACHANCRAALERAVSDGLIGANPAEGCKLPPKKAKEMQVLTHDEMKRFLLQAKEEGVYEMAVLELSTGLRRGEICALKWDDLDMETGELRIERQACKVSGELLVSQPKTRSSVRTVILPPSVLRILCDYKPTVDSRWMFPSPVKPDSPWEPSSLRRKMQRVMEHAGCKVVRFHDLRHTFATMALEHGMDVKTLSAVIGHSTAKTTLDVYSHVTDEMQRQAAANIERGFGVGEAHTGAETPISPPEEAPPTVKFTPYKGKIRRRGTGCLHRINARLWEGSYSPTIAPGKRKKHNVYAHTREECETLLAEMIARVRADIADEKAHLKAETAVKI